jgi:hypothetical protein
MENLETALLFIVFDVERALTRVDTYLCCCKIPLDFYIAKERKIEVMSVYEI